MPVKTLVSSLLALSSLAACAVELRVAAFNIGAQFEGSNPIYSLGDPGTPDYETVKSILTRIDADVVSLEEIDSADVSGSPGDLATLAASLNYPHVYIAPTSGSLPTYTAPFDNGLRCVILSRFPFITTGSITSPPDAREMTRFLPAVKVDVPGTVNDPLVIGAHLKSGDGTDERFRRLVEMKRLAGYLTSQGISEDDNYIIIGDFNMVGANRNYDALPTTGLPVNYDLGGDISFPQTYTSNPLAYFSTPGVVRLTPQQLNGSQVTFPSSGNILDLMMVSPAIAGRIHGTEIYNSALDVSNSGLAKAGDPLPPDTSATASDHFALFGDFELDADLPNLNLALSLPAVLEGMPDGTITATVTLPATLPQAVTITLSSDNPEVALPIPPVLQIPAGELSGAVGIRTPRNFLADEGHSVTISAIAAGHDPDTAVLQVANAEGPYELTGPGATVTENFNCFGGNHDPAPWTTSGGIAWRGVDDGSSALAGLRAYGSAADGSLGFLPGDIGTVASASFVNDSNQTLTSLQIGLDVEQWRSAQGGKADTLAAVLYYDGSSSPLPGLNYTASTALPSGPVSGGATTALSATATGLAIPPGASFELRFSFSPGPANVPPPADVFINEFHYDNTGTDTGEFIEVAVGAGFAGQLADLNVVLYSGETAASGVTYGQALNLATSFTAGASVDGYTLYVAQLPANGIQNGLRDGFAIVNTTNNQVLQLLSYEGVFTASNGPAAGMTSVNIGVAQNGTEPVGESSLGLTGSGAHAADFTWQKASGPYTAGQPNSDQTFIIPTPPSQGISIDNLSVSFLSGSTPDHDGDGIADSLDPDDDNDTQTDADELAFGTNPLDATSFFRPQFTRAALPPRNFELRFPAAVGITYTVESSTDLEHWTTVDTYPGAGAEVVVPFPLVEGGFFVRVKAEE